jgi:hypothetical protein
VQATIRPEQLALGQAHREADAVVAHEEAALALVLAHADLDRRLGSLGGELERVGEQVLEHAAQQLTLPAHAHARADHAARVRRLTTQLGPHLARERAEVDLHERQLGAALARMLEQSVQTVHHPVRRGRYLTQEDLTQLRQLV